MSKRVTDEDEYIAKEYRQQGPGNYHVNASGLLPDNRTYIPNDIRIRPQITGSIQSSHVPPVEAESDLRGLDRPTNRTPMDYRQNYKSRIGDYTQHHTLSRTPIVEDVKSTDVGELRTFDSRLDLPALALRGMTPNRFHPNLLHDPAEKAFSPFDRVVSSRIVMKDQWRVPYSSLERVNPPTIPGKIMPKSAF